MALAPPRRPDALPAGAEWDVAEQAWLVAPRDASGELHGALRVYAADGTLQVELEYGSGRRHGPFKRFHPSGKLAQLGRYFDDQLDGLSTSLSAGDESDSIRVCCLPPGTRRLMQEHRRGQLLAEAFFDAAGERLFEGEERDSLELREREDDVRAPSYRFWPEFERFPFVVAEEEVSVAQPLGELRDAIRRAAQRIEACRNVLLTEAPDSAPPDVSSLVGKPLALRQLSLVLPESDAPVLVTEALSVSNLTTGEVTWRARVEWMGLCWLCWAAGLDEVALPDRIQPRTELYAALVHAARRVERLEAGSPAPLDSRCFHGSDETLLPASALWLLAEHYREIRAMLLFVTDAECMSPWQDDLGRRADAS